MRRSCILTPCVSQALYPILTVPTRTGNTALTKGMGKVLNPPPWTQPLFSAHSAGRARWAPLPAQQVLNAAWQRQGGRNKSDL